ncbi:hypothetical protein B0H14DRAFT_3674017, partial [Mycena olivaceomarginata]
GAFGKIDGTGDTQIRPGETLRILTSAWAFHFLFTHPRSECGVCWVNKCRLPFFSLPFRAFRRIETDMRPLVHSLVQSSDGGGPGGRDAVVSRAEGFEARRGGRRERGLGRGRMSRGRVRVRAFSALQGEGGERAGAVVEGRQRQRLRGGGRLRRRAHAVPRRNERWVDAHVTCGLVGTGESVAFKPMQCNVMEDSGFGIQKRCCVGFLSGRGSGAVSLARAVV